MVFKSFCVLVPWTKVTSALKGLIRYQYISFSLTLPKGYLSLFYVVSLKSHPPAGNRSKSEPSPSLVQCVTLRRAVAVFARTVDSHHPSTSPWRPKNSRPFIYSFLLCQVFFLHPLLHLFFPFRSLLLPYILWVTRIVKPEIQISW